MFHKNVAYTPRSVSEDELVTLLSDPHSLGFSTALLCGNLLWVDDNYTKEPNRHQEFAIFWVPDPDALLNFSGLETLVSLLQIESITVTGCSPAKIRAYQQTLTMATGVMLGSEILRLDR